MNFADFSIQYPTLANENPIDVLRLIRTPNVGPITFFQLIRRFRTAANALKALPELSLRGGRKQPLVACLEVTAQKEMDAAQKFGARMILYGMPDYPRLLHTIPDPPPLITVSGHPHLWQKSDAIAMVGARNASANGCQFAGRLAKELGESGLITVSGLARGIDSFVHKGSLATGTVAVIAGGIDNIYPPENEPLYQQLRESGAIISEQPFGALPYSGAFPGRNRIIAGMSLGTVVVEASPKSGSLITARFATENNREVFAIPGSPLDPRSRGCNQLIKQGATMAESASDILQGITHLRNTGLKETPPLEYDANLYTAPADNDLDEIRRVVTGKLSTTPVLVDELIEQCGAAPGAIMTVLLELELAGRLKRGAGNRAYLIGAMAEESA
jgi:DNA processing protein